MEKGEDEEDVPRGKFYMVIRSWEGSRVAKCIE
jgi:hypothetical protein